MHEIETFYDDETGDSLRVTKSLDCEYVSPQSYLFSVGFNNEILTLMDISIGLIKAGKVDPIILDSNTTRMFETFKKSAIEKCKKYQQLIYSVELPESLFDIFKSEKKKKHEKAFRNVHLTMDKLLCFYFKAFDLYNCTYSKYLFINKIDEEVENKMPKMALINNDSTIKKYGKSELSDGQIRHHIQQQKCMRVDILDNGYKWYCFYWTWNAISGKESSKHFEEHIHYIDYTWELSREYVLGQLNSKRYSLSGIHISFERHPHFKK